MAVLPKVSLKDNPVKVTISRITGGGLILMSKDLHYRESPIELTLNGNTYKIKGMDGAYSF